MLSDAFEVYGGNNLSGTITPQGAKNEALQVICAVLLTSEKVTIANIPQILDVKLLIELLEGLGVKVEQKSKHSAVFQADDLDLDYCYSEEFRKKASRIRGSVMLIGPLLARFGKATLPKPGGDKIGRRSLDTHFNSFIKLGGEFTFDKKENIYYVETEKLKGCYMLMDEISVTGTANTVMAAVLAEGTTQIYNAACEPYLQQLCEMLNRMGAKISGVGSNLLTIEGVSELKGTEHRMLPDMIEVGSFIGLAAMTASELTIEGIDRKALGIIPRTFQRLGIDLQFNNGSLTIPKQEKYKIQTNIDGSIPVIYDAPWPGFTPDLLSIILVVAIQARGSLLVHQKMFESRLFFVDKLIDMGAQIILCDPHRATVIGLGRDNRLRGIEMASPDIRAGVALLIAALSANGKSIIHNIHQIDRGYERIDERLNALGAEIIRH
jgi:UDP-N-acetylglucosamine 1-carboxyvinyltransferase